MVEFRLLGAVEVVADGVPLDVGHARQRDLLAVLLIEAGQVVPIDRLADRAWGAKLPRKPNDALYSYLSRLRTAFRGIDDVTIKRQRGGYSLAVDPRAVDVHLFAWLVGKARAAGDDHAALALFDEALALWRGRALDGLDSPWSDSVRADLDRQRYAAVLERNDLRLRTGRHADVLAELSDEPMLDERAAAQLVEALQLDGRPADALREFERVRRRLADELGADPGPRLRELHQRILTTEAAGAGMPGPRQLPAPPSMFTGRTAELAALDDLLAEPGSLVVVTGSGGIGKTWLTLRWAADHVSRFADGQLYVNLRGYDPVLQPVAATSVLHDFLAALGIAPEFIPPGVEARAAMYRNLSAGRSMLIVLDNARDTTQITPLLPGGSSCSVLVTSRHQLGGLLTTHGARALPVRHLHDGEARALLERRLGAAKLRDDPEAGDEIVRHCAGLPLALAIVAARALSDPDLGLAALVADLRDARLDTLDAGELPANLRAAFSASYRALDPEAARAFRVLGLVPGADIGSGAAAALIGAARPLRGLTAANLLRESPPGRFRVHDLVRLYARELADAVDDPGDRKAALDRLFDHYVRTASAAMDLFAVHEPYRRPPVPGQPTPSFAGYVEARAWLDTERPALLAMGAHAAAFGHERHVIWLAAVLYRYLDVTAHYEDALTLHSNALAFTDPGSLARGIAHHAVGWTLIRLGREEEAAEHLRQALSSAQDHQSDLLESAVRDGLASVHDRSGERSSARRQHELALAAARRAGHVHLEGIALCNLGEHSSSSGDHQEALRHLRECGRIAREIGDGGLAGRIFAALGRTYAGLGRTDEAARHLQRALHFARFGGNTTLEVSALNDLGAVVTAAEALDHHEQALALAQRIGHRHELVRAHHGLAEAHRQLNNHTKAELHAARADQVLVVRADRASRTSGG